MTKRQLIDEIITNNHTASPGFLAQFSDEDLSEYLAHLKWLRQPRLSGDPYRFEKYFRTLSRPLATPPAEPAPPVSSPAPTAEEKCEETPAETHVAVQAEAPTTLMTTDPPQEQEFDDGVVDDSPASAEEFDGVYVDESTDDVQDDRCYQAEQHQEIDCDSELEQARHADQDKAEQAGQTADNSESEPQSWLF